MRYAALGTLLAMAPGLALASQPGFAPAAASAAVREVCASALRAGTSVEAAAEKRGWLRSQSRLTLPSTFEGAAVFQAPSRDGEVLLAAKSKPGEACQILIAHAPPGVDALVAAELVKAGMRPGATGEAGPNVRWRQVGSADGGVNVTVLGYEPVGPHPSPIRAIVQVY